MIFAENANYDEKITIINEHPLLRIGKDPLFVLICDSRVFSPYIKEKKIFYEDKVIFTYRAFCGNLFRNWFGWI